MTIFELVEYEQLLRRRVTEADSTNRLLVAIADVACCALLPRTQWQLMPFSGTEWGKTPASFWEMFDICDMLQDS